jgi:hypothetical protein
MKTDRVCVAPVAAVVAVVAAPITAAFTAAEGDRAVTR